MKKPEILILTLVLGLVSSLAFSLLAPPAATYAQSGENLPLANNSILATGQVPVNGTSEIQTLIITNLTTNASNFKLEFMGKSALSGNLVSTNSTAQVDAALTAALEGMPTIGTGGVSIVTTGTATGALTNTITFGGNLVKLAVDQIVATTYTGTGAIAAATTTPGVTADGRQSRIGQLLKDQGAGVLYINTSTNVLQPTWTKVGAQ